MCGAENLDNEILCNRIIDVAEIMGRRQVVRQLVLVQPSRRFESFRPRFNIITIKIPPRVVFFIVHALYLVKDENLQGRALRGSSASRAESEADFACG